jgi:hypothetical protein
MRRLADWAARPRGIYEWWQLGVTTLVLGSCTLFVFIALHPSKLFLNTLTAGGDMGAHVWAPWFLRHHLFPHGRISGWAPAWYDGFPALTFYFPGPYLVIALLSYILPYDIAFKLVSVSGVVLLPLCAYAFGRLLRMRFPGPELLAVAMVPFLFDRYWTIYGGNIASTLAGEFCFEISLCCALLFIGVFARSLETGKYRWLAAFLLGATLLSHLLPAFFAIVGAGIVWLTQLHRRTGAPSPMAWARRQRLGVAIVIGVVGLALTGFWLIPFAMRLGYSNDMGWERTTAFMKGLFPFLCNTHKTDANVNCPAYNVVAPYTAHLKVVVALAAAGVLGGVALLRRATLVIVGLGAAAAAAFRLMPQGTLWNARMLPFWYLSLYLAAGACLGESASALGVLFGRAPRRSDSLAADEPLVDVAPERELVGVGAGGPSGPFATGDGGDGADVAVAPMAGAGPPGLQGPWDADWAGPPDELQPARWPGLVVAVLALALVLAFIGQTIPDYNGITRAVFHNFSLGGKDQRANPNFVSSWANWNYSGYQKKTAYPEYRDVVDTMTLVGRQHGCGRAMWEYEPEEDRFGTPMALMLLPMWTNGCIGSQEGLFFESSATVPYHFLNQSELSENPSRAMRLTYITPDPYRSYDIVDGIAHLRLLGVRYYMAISPAAQAAAQGLTTGPDPMLTLVASTGSHQVQYTSGSSTTAQPRTWQVYQVADSAPVAPLTYEPAVLTHAATTSKGWNKISIPWYQDQSRWGVELATSGPASWPRVRASADSDPPRIPVHAATVSNITMTDDRISFDVDPETVRSASPVLVKTSYFPNWQASGANGPWRVTPNLMVVVPTRTHVELHYGFTPVDNVGRLASLAALVAIGAMWWYDRGLPSEPVPVAPPLVSDEREADTEPGDRVPVPVGGNGDGAGGGQAVGPWGLDADDAPPPR